MKLQSNTAIINGLQEAFNRAHQMKKPILFSYSRPCRCESPFTFLRRGESQFRNRRFLFRKAQVTFVGLGSAMTVKANGDARFQLLTAHWRHAIENFVALADQSIDAEKPMLFGGFSFDAKIAHSSLWAPYADALFYLPTWLYHCRDKQRVLTHFICCSPDCSYDQLTAQFKKEEAYLSQLTSQKRTLSTDEPQSLALQNRQQWRHLVDSATQEMKRGVLNKVVLARALQVSWDAPPDWVSVLERLNTRQAGNFLFALEREGRVFLGATPERLIMKKGKRLETACVAGSAPRGQTSFADRQLAEALLADRKNRQEHHYVVQMVMRAIKEHAAAINFPVQPQIMKNKNIQHLYTPVTAMATDDHSLFDWVQRLHPTPALGGLPQKQAVDWLRAHEGLDRGFYGAPIGWCDSDGNGEFAVAIRSAIFCGEKAVLYAGCGVIEDSDPDSEFDETALKFRPMLDVL